MDRLQREKISNNRPVHFSPEKASKSPINFEVHMPQKNVIHNKRKVYRIKKKLRAWYQRQIHGHNYRQPVVETTEKIRTKYKCHHFEKRNIISYFRRFNVSLNRIREMLYSCSNINGKRTNALQVSILLQSYHDHSKADQGQPCWAVRQSWCSEMFLGETASTSSKKGVDRKR
jgi:hypothetical protein